MVRDDPFRSAPLRIPEAPAAPPRPWLTPKRLEHLRHAVLIEGTAVMVVAMLAPIRPLTIDRITTCREPPSESYPLCGHACTTISLRDPAAELRTGLMIALVVGFVGFVLGRAHWLVRPSPDPFDHYRQVRRGAFCALAYAAVGFLVAGFWAPFSVERPVITPVFLALSGVALVTRTE